MRAGVMWVAIVLITKSRVFQGRYSEQVADICIDWQNTKNPYCCNEGKNDAESNVHSIVKITAFTSSRTR